MGLGTSGQGLFITFEGPEGSGKSTQINKLKDYLIEKGKRVQAFREPGGTPVSETIRQVLLNPGADTLKPRTELLLFLAARNELLENKIEPAIQSGDIVLCDRYEDSTLAYQGFGRSSLGFEKVQQMCDFVSGTRKPDITFLLDIDPLAGMKRGGRHDRMEKESLEFHRRVRDGFLKLAKMHSERFVILDALKAKSELSQEIIERVTRELG